MNELRKRKTWIVFIAVLMLFAACKGESPTAPPPGGGIPPGGTAPPTGVNVVLAVSNANPVVDSTVTVTATVTQNNAPVPNGTAVEFSTTEGTLDSGGQSVIKTTTNGVATVTLTRGTVGSVTVTAVVNNVSRTIPVNFVARPITPQPPNTTPTITGVTPNVGRPTGGETIRISGTNFTAPVRVLFRYAGLATPIEAFVVSVTPTQIEAVTPSVNLGAGQQLIADVIVLTQAGTANENRAELAGAFTFRNEQLTPVISTVTPNSGPVLGGTRVTIFGEGFQEPVQVLFGTAEARVLNVKFGEILVETPAGRDTSETGAGPVLGGVDVVVRNINSNRQGALTGAFFYKNAVQIIAVAPGGAIAGIGGTRVTIEGNGFVAPVVVNIRTPEGDITLQPISVSGTRIVAIAPAILPGNCEDLIGDLIVTNIVNGDQAIGPPFTFFVPQPSIVNVSPSSVLEGAPVVVTVANAIPGASRIVLGDRTVFPSAVTFDEQTRIATFTIAAPTGVEFETQACTVGGVAGERLIATPFDVTYLNAATGCEDTATEALRVNPPDTSCVTPPPAPVATVSPAGTPGSCANVGSIVAAGAAAGSANITITNSVGAGGQSLTISGATVSGENASFGITPTGAGPIAPGGNAVFTVSADPTAPGPITGTVTFTTNDPNRATITVCITGNGT